MEDRGSLAELLLEQSPACQWLVSASGIFERIYGDSTSVFGKPSTELAGKAITSILAPDASNAWINRFARAFAGDSLALRERRGEATWYIAIFPVRRKGSVAFAGGVARETTAFGTGERELRRTVMGALKAQEFERAMVARFLHDSVGQNLTALGLQLDLIRMDVEAVSPETCGRIEEIQQVLGAMMEQVRGYCYELNPSAVERAGLRSALDRLAERLRERFSGMVRVNVDPSLKLDPELSKAFFHIAQEAVKNSVQHSSCSTVEIAVKSSRIGTFLEVRDNGRGFEPADPIGGCRGLGLLSMEHYAAEAGLDLRIISSPKTGTLVRATTQEDV